MGSEIRCVDYFYAMVPDKPGEAACVLDALCEAGVNLIAFSGFPEGRKGQLDFVPSKSVVFLKAAKKIGLSVSKKRTGFLIQAKDKQGAVADVLSRLAEAKINVVAMQAICSGGGRFGGLLWVKAADVKKAAKALGAA